MGLKPPRAGQVPLILEAEGGEDELERGGGGGGGEEKGAGPSGTRGRGSRGRATELQVSVQVLHTCQVNMTYTCEVSG